MKQTAQNQSDELVFLVDDDASFRKSTARLLALSGFTVHEYASAGEFLIGFSRESRGCLLLDIRTPGSDGFDLLKHLRSEGVGVPVVFLTGHGDVPTAVRAIQEGALDLLTKPVKKKKLIDTVKNALSVELESRQSQAQSSDLKQRFKTLTPNEKKIYRMIVGGLPNKAIAADLGNAERTIKLHRSSLSRKMGAQCIADLVRFYYEGNLR